MTPSRVARTVAIAAFAGILALAAGRVARPERNFNAVGPAGLRPFDLTRAADRVPEARPDTGENRAAVLARPLFAANRRPPASPAAAPSEPATIAQPPPPPEPLVLVGVVAGDGNARALVVSASAPEGRWLAVGDAVAGQTVSSIGVDRVVLTGAPGEQVLQLYVENRN